MIRTLMIAAASAAVIALSPAAFAQQTGGTAEEAKAMLMKAAAAVKEDQTKALDMFNKGEGGFLDRDLYVFCAHLDGKLVAVGNPNAKQLLGTDTSNIKDSTGKNYGQEIQAAFKNKPIGELTEVSYTFVKPAAGADKTPVPKISLVTRVSDDLGCGVGYYK